MGGGKAESENAGADIDWWCECQIDQWLSSERVGNESFFEKYMEFLGEGEIFERIRGWENELVIAYGL